MFLGEDKRIVGEIRTMLHEFIGQDDAPAVEDSDYVMRRAFMKIPPRNYQRLDKAAPISWL